jgi:hypothetical protein
MGEKAFHYVLNRWINACVSVQKKMHQYTITLHNLEGGKINTHPVWNMLIIQSRLMLNM